MSEEVTICAREIGYGLVWKRHFEAMVLVSMTLRSGHFQSDMEGR